MEDQSKNKMLEIENKDKMNQILKAFNHNYDELVNHINIVNG